MPVDTIEAARIDGANERQITFRVIVPRIWGTVITVPITVLRAFDIVFVMTNGNFNTDTVAVRFFNELFGNGDNGKAAAIVVMLMICFLWLGPTIGIIVTSFRTRTRPSARAGGRSSPRPWTSPSARSPTTATPGTPGWGASSSTASR